MNNHHQIRFRRGGLWYALFVVAFLAVVTPLVTRPAATPKAGKPADKPVEQRVQVKVRKIIEPPRPAPQSQPAAPNPAPPPKPTPVSKALAEAPAKKAESQAGAALAISAGYRQYLGWPGYLREMTRLGGVFYLFDPFYEKIKAQIEFHPVQFKDVDVAALKRMSPRIREISGEIAISDALSQARVKFGPGRYAVILLLPHAMDSRVQTDAVAGLSANDLAPAEIVRLNGEYQTVAGHLELRIHEAIRNDGVIVPMKFTVRM